VSDPRRRQLAAYVLAGVVLVALGARWVQASDGPRRPAPAPAEAANVRVGRTAGDAAVVHVAGEVREPGVYRFRAPARVEEAVRRAGGPTRRANLDALSLAARIDDGRQIVVPGRAGAAAAAVPATDGTPQGPVNLNTATAEQLGTLDGVGPATAGKILAYRQEHGGFGSVDELDQVPGIGAKRLAALRPRVTV
jgi:competence protein ComEA